LSICISADGIRVGVYAEDWRAAIRLAGGLLVNQGSVSPAYVHAMEQIIDEAGPYCVVAPGLALPHARPGSWVSRSSIGVLVLVSPVRFGLTRNDPVDVIVPFAATDCWSHFGTLTELARLFVTPASLVAIRQARSAAEIALLFNTQHLVDEIAAW